MRIKINKYLRNIGINENTYWVMKDKVEGDPRYEEYKVYIKSLSDFDKENR